jgi:signal transduction histidine kinase/ActR/RegA family two-component response regulator
VYRLGCFILAPLLAVLAICQTGDRARQIPPRAILQKVRIGADHAPPYYYVRPGVKIEGLGVDVLNAAASRAGITLEWTAQIGSLEDEFDSGRLDVWPASSVTPIRKAKYHFTKSWLINSFCLISKSGSGIRKPADTAHRRVAAWYPPLVQILARQFLPSAVIAEAESREQALIAVCSGTADAAMLETRFLDVAMLNRPALCEQTNFQVAVVPGARTELGVSSTRQAAATADLLQDSISALALDGTLSQIMERWASFSSPDSRSVYALEEAQRRNQLYAYGLALLLAAGVVLSSQIVRAHAAQRRAKLAQSAAERANSAKTSFLTNMSHEIRTPLSGIIGMTNLVLGGELTEAKRGDVKVVLDSAMVLLNIINDVLDLAKIEAGRVTIVPVPFRLRSTLAGVVNLFAPHATAKHLALTWSCDAQAPDELRGDVTRVQQIVGNYVANAVKFTSEGSVHLSVRVLERRGDEISLHFAVDDTGIGIPRAVQASLFAKFVQADASTTRKYGGTGLGLAISKTLAELMAGRVGVESEVDRGSNFWVDLPFQVEAAAAVLVQPRIVPPGVAPLAFSPRILVAEDNPVNRRIILSLLEKLGCNVETAVNGTEALQKWRERPYDLILMDCQMPELDGYEATTAIRRDESGGIRIPIVAVTAHALSEDENRCRRAGMDDYIRKPIDLAQLAAVVEKYARGKSLRQ